jgi:hypothetical protein
VNTTHCAHGQISLAKNKIGRTGFTALFEEIAKYRIKSCSADPVVLTFWSGIVVHAHGDCSMRRDVNCFSHNLIFQVSCRMDIIICRSLRTGVLLLVGFKSTPTSNRIITYICRLSQVRGYVIQLEQEAVGSRRRHLPLLVSSACPSLMVHPHQTLRLPHKHVPENASANDLIIHSIVISSEKT